MGAERDMMGIGAFMLQTVFRDETHFVTFVVSLLIHRHVTRLCSNNSISSQSSVTAVP